MPSSQRLSSADSSSDSGRRVYRANGADGGKVTRGEGPASREYRRPRDTRRSRLLAVVVLVVMAIVIVLVGVIANGSSADTQSTGETFKLLPITTTTS